MGITRAAKVTINSVLRTFGYYVTKTTEPNVTDPSLQIPKDFSESDRYLWETVSPYTMTSPERIYSLSRSIEYIVKHSIPGDIVECGVWKGGSSMAIALTLMQLGDTSRNLYLYDTFDSGWPAGEEHDVTMDGRTAHQLWLDALARGESPDTLFAKFASVQEAMNSTGYPTERIHLVRGKVEDTIPGIMPDRIALLRLDTDWYSSTRHELTHLYPRLENLGVLMLDDYGYFRGARKASDEYFSEHNVKMLLHRVDDGGYRVGIKV